MKLLRRIFSYIKNCSGKLECNYETRLVIIGYVESSWNVFFSENSVWLLWLRQTHQTFIVKDENTFRQIWLRKTLEISICICLVIEKHFAGFEFMKHIKHPCRVKMILNESDNSMSSSNCILQEFKLITEFSLRKI